MSALMVTILLWAACKEAPKEEPKQEIVLLSDEDNEFVDWPLKDFGKDSIPGISLEKAYEELNIQDSGQEVIVAVIDTKIDIEHEDLKQQIFINKDEIPNNNKDDDGNGYIDDVNGWNFLGYGDNKSLYVGSGNHMKILRKYSDQFKDKDSSEISQADEKNYKRYLKALDIQKNDIDRGQGIVEYGEILADYWKKSVDAFGDEFVNDDITRQVIDSLKPKNEEEETLVEFLGNIVDYSFQTIDFEELMTDGALLRDSVNSFSYNERLLIGDNENDLNDTDYGNPLVHDKNFKYQHGTKIAGAIAATRNNHGGIRGASNNIKIMPISISPLGYENDKDFYLAVKYACDNGADIINFSSGQYLAMNEDFLKKAILYAESKDVLIVTSAGNDGVNLDKPEDNMYPLDYDENGGEFAGNLIRVGASSSLVDENLFWAFSNYGKQNVDLFAPGTSISVAHPGPRKYLWNREDGTSMSAAYTSGVAALLKSHYPSLTSKEIKGILMDSGEKYDIDVLMGEELVPFESLSKSGRILNAYNALKEAASLAGKKL